MVLVLIAAFAATVLIVISVVVYWLRKIDAEIKAGNGVNSGAHLKVKRGYEEPVEPPRPGPR